MFKKDTLVVVTDEYGKETIGRIVEYTPDKITIQRTRSFDAKKVKVREYFEGKSEFNMPKKKTTQMTWNLKDKLSIPKDMMRTHGGDNKITLTTTLNIGALAGSISEFYSICRMYNVEVVSCNSLGGFLVKSYHVTLKGSQKNIRRVSAALRGY